MINLRNYTDMELAEVILGILKSYPKGLTMPRIAHIIGRENVSKRFYILKRVMTKLITEKKVRAIDYGGVSLYKVNAE